MIWFTILILSIVIFLSRYAFLEPRLPFHLGYNGKLFLRFAVPGMITAICGPIIFMPDSQLNLHWNNPYLLGSLVAIFLVLTTKNTLISVAFSMAVFFALRFWM